MKPKILLVDDEELNLLTFEAVLGGDNYDLHFARSGRAALEMAALVVPDLILLDVMMPEMDGYSVCRALRGDPKFGSVPIIIVTALHDQASRLQGLRAGADDFLTKPCSRDEVRARVRTIVSLNRFRTMAEQRARYERLHDLAPASILLVDELGVIASANPDAQALLGRDGVSVVGRALRDFVGETAGLELVRIIDDALNNRHIPPTTLRTGSGAEERILRVRASVVPDEGRPRAMLVLDDVSAEVRAKESLERLNEELDQKVQARTRQLEEANTLLLSYASFVSHDLRSPLAVIKGYLSMIAEGVVPVAQGGEIVKGAYDATLMMQELVQNILQLAHDEHAGARSGEMPYVDPTPIVHRVWMHVGNLFPNSGRVFKVGALPHVCANGLLIERVLYNLLTNAVKYSADRRQPLIEVGAKTVEGGAALYVRDNGIGFDARDSDKLFKEFSRLPDGSSQEGLGLGLSLVARLVRAHGGRLWAEGVAGQGATFYVQFPDSAAAAEPAAAAV